MILSMAEMQPLVSPCHSLSPFEHVDFRSTDYSLILSLRFAMAESESNKISERTRDGLNQSNREGYFTGTAPFGYKRIESPVRTPSGKKRKILVPDKNAPYVAEIFKRFADGEDRGELYHEYKNKITISKTRFYEFLKNPIYAGFIDVGAYWDFPVERIKAKHDPIVDEKLFESVPNLLLQFESPRRSTSGKNGVNSEHFYLKGILVCDISGKSMTGSLSKGRSKHYPYYQTISGKQRQSYRKETAHQIVDEAIEELSMNFTEEDVTYVQKVLGDMVEPKKEILKNMKFNDQSLTKKIQRIEGDYLNGGLLATDYRRLNTTLLAEKAKLTRDMTNLERQIKTIPKVDLNLLNSLGNIPQIYANGDTSLKRQLLKAIFPEKFSIDPTKRKVRTTYINQVLYTNDYKSDNYKFTEIKKDEQVATRPVRGGRRDSNPRPLEPQSSALTN